jgi:sugar lactone lactonase YvrE
MGLMLSVAPMAMLSLVPAALAQTQEASEPLLKAGMTQGEPRGPVQIPDAPQLPYHYGARPVAPNGEKFGNVAAVALMPNGDLLVFNRNPAIMMVEYDPTGTHVVRVFNPNIAMNPHGLRVDRHGNIWAIDSFLNVIFKMNGKGEVLKMLGIRGENGPWDDSKWNGMFNQPLDIAFDKDDNFYVVQSHGGTSPPADCTFCATYDSAQTRNAHGHAVLVSHPPVIPGSDPRVMKFDKDFHFIASASLAHPDGKFPTIHSVIVAPNGEVWVGDRAAEKIIVFDKDLKNRHEIQEHNLTCGFYEDATGQLWMSTGRNGLVLKMGWDGKVQGWFGHHGDNTDSNDIGEGHYMAVSKDQKTIFVADTVLAHVIKLEHN